ncbi:MAG TPA: hypothetical protein VFR17_01055 [Mycobacterium sp.]|nr:hypothetical protein [Mycobacterium sp.]
MNGSRFFLGCGAAVGAGLAAAVFSSAVAAAYIGYDGAELPPGTGLPTGPPTDVTNYQGPFYFYEQSTTPYNVLDSGNNVVGTLDETRTDSSALGASWLQDVVSNGTGTAAPWDGSEFSNFQESIPFLSGFFVIFGNDYLHTPLGESDYVTLLNFQFPLFDTFSTAPASTAAVDLVDPNWLSDWAGPLDLGSLL